jgi:hypothetical protein
MRFFSSLFALSLALGLISCKTHDRQQYSYSYKKPVHVAKEKNLPPPPTAPTDAQGANAAKPAEPPH